MPAVGPLTVNKPVAKEIMLFLFAGVFLARRYLAVIFQCRKVRVWHMSGRGGMRRQKAGEVSPFNVQPAWPAVGSSHLGLFFPSKGTQTCGRRVPPTAFWCRQTPGHLEGIPRLPRAPQLLGVTLAPPATLRCGSRGLLHLQGSPWERVPPPSAAASAPGPALLGSPAPPGPSDPFLAQPPPKPGEVESRRRCSLRGPRGAALGMLSRRSQCCSK